MQTISPQIEVDKEMAAKCRRLRTLQKKVESTQAQIKTLRAEIEAEFRENGEEIYYRGILLATFTTPNFGKDTRRLPQAVASCSNNRPAKPPPPLPLPSPAVPSCAASLTTAHSRLTRTSLFAAATHPL
jgi:hypothetical protein